MLVLFGLPACTPQATDLPEVRTPPPPVEGEDNFGGASTVRITAPVENESVASDFELAWTLGEDVRWLQVSVDGRIEAPQVDGRDGGTTLTADAGRRSIRVIAYDADWNELSRDDVVVRVLDDAAQGFVNLVSPIDGSHPTNPVQFAVEASDTVVDVELLADGWSLGHLAPGQVLTYRFSGTGYARTIEAHGTDADGNEVSVDTISVTVEAGATAPPSDFNAMVLSLVDDYPTDSSIDYYWPSTGGWPGNTRNLYYQGDLVAEDRGFSSCYCVGLTWEIYYRAWQEYDRSTGGTGDDLNGLATADVLDMRTDWYVRELDGPGASVAFEGTGLGITVDSFDDWRPGDFIQFWRRSGSGHNVIFEGWITDDAGNRIGMDYFACNGTSSTDGPGFNDEYFTGSNAMDPLRMYNGRGLMPGDWY